MSIETSLSAVHQQKACVRSASLSPIESNLSGVFSASPAPSSASSRTDALPAAPAGTRSGKRRHSEFESEFTSALEAAWANEQQARRHRHRLPSARVNTRGLALPLSTSHLAAHTALCRLEAQDRAQDNLAWSAAHPLHAIRPLGLPTRVAMERGAMRTADGAGRVGRAATDAEVAGDLEAMGIKMGAPLPRDRGAPWLDVKGLGIRMSWVHGDGEGCGGRGKDRGKGVEDGGEVGVRGGMVCAEGSGERNVSGGDESAESSEGCRRSTRKGRRVPGRWREDSYRI